jgi:uncharacterized SAM-binding protein YcdF (DUF218 family)
VFYVLSKVFDLLLAPITWVLLLAAGSVLLRRRTVATWLAGAAAAVLWIFSAEPVANELTRLAEAGVRSTQRPGVVYDAAIVLGGGIDPSASKGSGETELNAAGDRILAGYALLLSGQARNVLLSAGGPDASEPVEADWGAATYRRLGIPADRVVVERESRNTLENAQRSARIVRERGWRSLLLVTSAMHMPRAAATFRKAGLEVDLLPVDRRYGPKSGNWMPRVESLERSTGALRELAGRLVYRAAAYSGS